VSEETPELPEPTVGDVAQGIVTEVGSRSVRVWFEGLSPLRCTLRGNLWAEDRNESRPVAVGDRVGVRIEGGGEGVIESVEERTNVLSRPHPKGGDGTRSRDRSRRPRPAQVIAANLDRLIVVAALVDPPFRPGLVDRFLVTADMQGIDPVVCINKVDLDPEGVAFAHELAEPYVKEGVPVHITSAETGLGIEDLGKEMATGISLLVGHSGVGKSSLLNAVSPGLGLRIGHVADYHGRGRHTTTRVSLLQLSSGGWVVDSPGIREFGLSTNIPAAELARLFPGFGRLPEGCRFNNCLHRNEPDCAVVSAVEDEQLSVERYESYLRILEELDESPEN
jgi:ribosome biogenesis GTPase